MNNGSFLHDLGYEITELVDISNSVNKTVLTGLSSVLRNISRGLDLRNELNSEDQENLIDLSHRINLIKKLDVNSKEYLDHLRVLLYLDKGENPSLLHELQNASLDVLDMSTSLNRFILNSTAKLLDNVSNSPSLLDVVEDSNINLLELVHKMDLLKKVDNGAKKILNTELLYSDRHSNRLHNTL
jgi:hypothetical protein